MDIRLCPIYKICMLIENTMGQYVTIRPGRLLGFRGRTAEVVEHVLVNEFGCEKLGSSRYKYVCPIDRLRELCRIIKLMSGGSLLWP